MHWLWGPVPSTPGRSHDSVLTLGCPTLARSACEILVALWISSGGLGPAGSLLWLFTAFISSTLVISLRPVCCSFLCQATGASTMARVLCHLCRFFPCAASSDFTPRSRKKSSLHRSLLLGPMLRRRQAVTEHHPEYSGVSPSSLHGRMSSLNQSQPWLLEEVIVVEKLCSEPIKSCL